MKMLIAAAALTIASPAFAQAQDPHAGHAAGQEQHKDCCAEKDADGTRRDCCEPTQDGKPMKCCEQHAGKSADAHDGHDMSKH